jgi:hypothetical protein
LVPCEDGYEFVYRTIHDYLAAKYWLQSPASINLLVCRCAFMESRDVFEDVGNHDDSRMDNSKR